jgi:(1->4)-alpha-D-glucan 1-alpha-D-glucosylmutase
MEKATREAKQHTSWTAPQQAYEAALRAFITGALADPEFTAVVERFVRAVLWPGRVVSLAQTLIKLTAPGVPDVYQGTELWSLSLVDPDNRRPVDYQTRRQLLEAARRAGPEEALARADEGLPKLWLVQRALALRAERPAAFGPGADGAYQPVAARGVAADRVLAFARGGVVATVVPRLARTIRDAREWDDTAVDLPPGSWRNALTGDGCAPGARASELFARFPVALLVRE